MDMGDISADSWWKLITPKEIKAGINQLNGRKILILNFVSSDIVLIKQFQLCVIYFFNEKMISSVTYIKLPSKESLFVCCS
tara:strand:+ start:178 stop:420 length:243 start_codon:yes stop_codon:yes gene_type:complete